MRAFNATEISYLQGREGYVARGLLWLQPRDTATGLRVGLGFWTGEEDATFTIDAASRLYTGGGMLASIDPIVMQSGLIVRMQRVVLRPLFAEVAQLLRGYDPWRAPAEIHRAFYNLTTGALLAEPRRVWKGVIDQAPVQTPAIGGESVVQVSLSSAAESLTRSLTLTRSDAVQSQRGGDRFYRYKDVSGSVPVSWGEIRATLAVAAPVLPTIPGGFGRGSQR